MSVSGSSGRTLSLFVDLHHDVRELVALTGFEPFIETQTKTMRDHAVVTALAERWRDSTNTLHLQFGEATMTPLDFSAITGLRVGGEPLPFDAGIAHSDDALRYYLGWKPNHGADSAGYGQFADHCLGRPTSRLAAEQKARCYLLYMFGATLFANRRHHVHLGYLAALRDFDRVARYDWGGWALASCYAFMGSVSRGVASSIGGLWSAWEVNQLTSPFNVMLH